MKRLFVFVPAIVLALFILNSFALKQKEAGHKTTEVAKSPAEVTLRNDFLIDPFPIYPVTRANMLVRSTDGGQTWQDLSKGLPEAEQPLNFFAGESGLYLQVKNAMYHSKPDLKTPVWEDENVPELQSASSRPSTFIAFNRPGVTAFNYSGQIYHKMAAAKDWLPVYADFKKHSLRTVFEAADGTVFLGYDHGLYKSTDMGKHWKQVQKGLVMNVAESEGVLIATGGKGIMRSTDHGDHWQWVISEGGVGIAVEQIKGGFAAISYNTATKSRRIRISLDRGNTWKAIDQGLPPSPFISSIEQVGGNLICGHPDGIFRSTDMGKTWNRVHAGAGKNLFRIAVSGNVLYAVAGSAGC